MLVEKCGKLLKKATLDRGFFMREKWLFSQKY